MKVKKWSVSIATFAVMAVMMVLCAVCAGAEAAAVLRRLEPLHMALLPAGAVASGVPQQHAWHPAAAVRESPLSAPDGSDEPVDNHDGQRVHASGYPAIRLDDKTGFRRNQSQILLPVRLL